MSHEHSGDEHGSADSRVPGGRGLPVRPEGSGDVRSDAGSDAESQTQAIEGHLQRDEPLDPENIAFVTSLVLAQINQHQHFHLEPTPDTAALAQMKREVPEVYNLWIESTKKRLDHDIWQSKKAVRQPYLLASIGQILGLIAVLGVLALAGYAVYLDHPWVGGIIAAIDILGLAAVFNGNQGRQRKARDDQADSQ